MSGATVSRQPSALADLPDQELAALARAAHANRGPASHFSELVRRYQVPLLRLLTRKLHNRGDAEDALQETFLRAYEKLDQYNSRWPFRTWIYTIAHRQAIGKMRSAKSRPAATGGDDPSLLHVRSPYASPDQSAQSRETRGRLWEIAKEKLTEDQFFAVWLFYAEDMTAPQIAEVMGRSWVSVKTMLFRARRILAVELAPLDLEEPSPAPSRPGQSKALSPGVNPLPRSNGPVMHRTALGETVRETAIQRIA